MIRFLDSFGQERAIECAPSFCGKYMNLTIYAPKKTNYGNTLQIPMAAFEEFKLELLKEKE